MKRLMILTVSALVAAMGFANDLADVKAKIGRDHKIVSVDKFHGFDRVVFDFEGHEAWVVCPEGGTREGRPWTWCMQWATAFVPRTNVPQMLRDGYHHVTINTFSHRMDETGLKVSAAFQAFLVERLGFAPKANLIGMSWGGFFSVRYANRYPQNVAKIYMDAPLLCFQDFRIGIGPWEKMAPADGWANSPEMPVNMAETIAKAGIPVLLLYGGMDTTCVPSRNCEPFVARFRKAGGEIEVVKRGLYAHHPHGVELDETTIKDFFERPPLRPVLTLDGEIGADAGWKSVEDAAKPVYLPFEGTFPSKGGRIVSPSFALDKRPDENAFYRLTFQARAEQDGYWWVDLYDEKGELLPDVNSRVYRSSDWRDYDVFVPTRPEAVRATLSFVGKKPIAARHVRMIRLSVAAAAAWCEKTLAEGPAVDLDLSVGVWDKLPNSRTAIRVAKDFTVVYLGDSIMNDTWCGGADALLRREYPDTVFHSYLSVRGSTGCWYYRDPKHFDEYVAKYRPNLVLIGGISNFKKGVTAQEAEDALVEVAERVKAIGAEAVICTPPKSVDFRKDATARPFDAALAGEQGPDYLRNDIHRRAAARADVQLWDLTTGPCEAVSRSGKPLGWFNRDVTHSDNRGKILNAQALYLHFNAAQK